MLEPCCNPCVESKNIFAVDDFVVTPPDTPVLIGVLDNDFAFLATIDPTSVDTTGLLAPSHGTISVDPVTGVITYTPDIGYLGIDTF